MNELLEKYNAELFKVGVIPKQSEGFCGQVGLRGLGDEKAQLEHASWMISEILDRTTYDMNHYRQLGIIQGILWSTKFRSMAEIKEENKNLNG